jgi:hypothetical protein
MSLGCEIIALGMRISRTRFECGEQRVQRHIERIAVKAEKDEIRIDDPNGLPGCNAELRKLQGVAPVKIEMKTDATIRSSISRTPQFIRSWRIILKCIRNNPERTNTYPSTICDKCSAKADASFGGRPTSSAENARGVMCALITATKNHKYAREMPI